MVKLIGGFWTSPHWACEVVLKTCTYLPTSVELGQLDEIWEGGYFLNILFNDNIYIAGQNWGNCWSLTLNNEGRVSHCSEWVRVGRSEHGWVDHWDWYTASNRTRWRIFVKKWYTCPTTPMQIACPKPTGLGQATMQTTNLLTKKNK